MWRILPAVPVGMKFACKLIQIKGDSVRLVGGRGGFDQPRIKRKLPH